MNYFIHDTRDLSPAYVKKCERFLWSLRNAGLVTKAQANTLFNLKLKKNKKKQEATSPKLQAASAMKRTQLKGKIKI